MAMPPPYGIQDRNTKAVQGFLMDVCAEWRRQQTVNL